MNRRNFVARLSSTIAIISLVGCAGVPTERKISRMATLAELAAFTGASIDLADNPAHRPYFEASRAALDGLVRSENYDPTAFAAALSGLPVKELKGEKGSLVVGAAVILWEEYAAEVVNLDRSTYVKPVIAAVAKGLARALGQSPAELAATKAKAIAPPR